MTSTFLIQKFFGHSYGPITSNTLPKYSTLSIRYYAFLSLAVALLSILTDVKVGKSRRNGPRQVFLKTYARWHLEATPESVLGRLVELHEADVGAVPEEEGEGLPPLDLVVQEEDDQHDERDRVEEDVPDERPGCQAEKKEQP